MKIAIPADEKKLDGGVCPSFGRTPYFLIYDSESKDAVFMDNSAAASQGGAGIKAAQTIADQGVKAVLAPRCGENAVNVLNQSGIALYKTAAGSLQENIDAFLADRLSPLSDIHPGFHGHEQ